MTIRQNQISNTSLPSKGTALASPPPPPPPPVTVQRERKDVITQVQEITQQDATAINRVIEACIDTQGRYSLEQVVSLLLNEGGDQCAKIEKESCSEQPLNNSPVRSQSVKPAKGVIDLTGESPESTDLQRAIQLSLQDSQGNILGGQITSEDREISQVIEASLAEANRGASLTSHGRKRDLWFVDPLNPHDRKRDQDWPVGLKNVGNTCWFSAVIQSLFHIPLLRHLVLQFDPPSGAKTRTMHFMEEIRKLFSLMQCSHRKYVDPSRVIETLKEAFHHGGVHDDSQQDVSEFTHKVLEWLEEAFQWRVQEPMEVESTTTTTTIVEGLHNPMLDLFYGQIQSEGISDGQHFLKVDSFGQYPLQVSGFRTIHDSLEAAMAPGEIVDASGSSCSRKGAQQEQWFTRLPPVIIFELSRFQFNQSTSRAEKVHAPFEFSETLFLDRYMEGNKERTRQCRELIKKLRQELMDLKRRLEKYVHYGEKQIPLQDILHSTLHFAESSVATTTAATGPGDSWEPMNVELSPESKAQIEGVHVQEFEPRPLSVTLEEIQVLRRCLHRWQLEVSTTVKDLQERIDKLKHTIDGMYNEDIFQRICYRLHSVLVHEGQASQGHYWAYIFSTERKTWLKFNDVQVTEAQWRELEKESFGGHHNASAYCLIYVDASRPDLLRGEHHDLLPDLSQVVALDNEKFVEEMENWDIGVQVGKLTGRNPTSEIVQDMRTIAREKETSLLALTNVKPTYPTDHATVAKGDSLKALRMVEEEIVADPVVALGKAVESEYHRLVQSASVFQQKLPVEDDRLLHFGFYLIVNDASKEVLEIVLYEHFKITIDETNKKFQLIQLAAYDLLEQKLKASIEKQCATEYQQWHEFYNHFRVCCSCFIKGADLFIKQRYMEALPYFCIGCDYNHVLHSGNKPMRSFHRELLLHFRRESLLKIHENAWRRFCESDDESAIEVLKELDEQCLPCQVVLQNSSDGLQDESCLELIRQKWCDFLGDEAMGKSKSASLQDFLSKLLDPPVSFRPEHAHKLEMIKTNLFESYCSVVRRLQERNLIPPAMFGRE